MFLCCQSQSARSKRGAAEAEARHSRLVSIVPRPTAHAVAHRNGGGGDAAYSPPFYNQIDSPPPCYEDATQGALSPYVGDQKHSHDKTAVWQHRPSQPQQPQQQQYQHQNVSSLARPETRPDPPTHSDEDSQSVLSSILSIPSTQVTGMTMTQHGTGTTAITTTSSISTRRDLTSQENASAPYPHPLYSVNDGGNRSETTAARTSSPASSSSSDGTGMLLHHPVMSQDWRDWVDGLIASRSQNAATRSRSR